MNLFLRLFNGSHLRIRALAINVDTSERQLTIPDVSKFVTCYTCNITKGKLPKGDNYCNMCDHYF